MREEGRRGREMSRKEEGWRGRWKGGCGWAVRVGEEEKRVRERNEGEGKERKGEGVGENKEEGW